MEEVITWEDLPRFMAEIRVLARDLLRREWHAESLQTTALVLTALRRQRLVGQDWQDVTWQDREHLRRALYQTMRRALIDHGRRRATQKHRAMASVHLEDLLVHDLPRAIAETPEQVVALDEALEQLAQMYPKGATVIEHRFYGGLTMRETAQAMGVSESTAKRAWEKARVLLYDEVLRQLNEA